MTRDGSVKRRGAPGGPLSQFARLPRNGNGGSMN